MTVIDAIYNQNTHSYVLPKQYTHTWGNTVTLVVDTPPKKKYLTPAQADKKLDLLTGILHTDVSKDDYAEYLMQKHS